MSVISAQDFGNNAVRTTGLPSGFCNGTPSSPTIGTCAPSQLASWLPLAKLNVAVR
jgi:hypothetical protein